MSDDHARRLTDKAASLDIGSMIAAEDDQKARGFLLVLHAISLSLEANTTTVRDISVKLEKHLETFGLHAAKEQELMNQGKGAWKIMAWVLAAAQGIGILMWNDTRNSQNESQSDRAAIRAELAAARMTDTKLESRIGVLEQAK